MSTGWNYRHALLISSLMSLDWQPTKIFGLKCAPFEIRNTVYYVFHDVRPQMLTIASHQKSSYHQKSLIL